MIIYLIEDNAGGLFIGSDNGVWHDVTELQKETQFADDAEQLAAGNTGDWTTEVYDERPLGDVVAEWKNGTVKLVKQIGIAANEYLAEK